MTTRQVDPVGALLGLVVPLLCAVAVLVLTRSWIPRLPGEIATHWSGTTPDAFGSPMTSAWTAALLIVLVGGGCCAIAALAQAQLLMRRYMLAIGLGVTGTITALFLAGLAGQLDTTDATQAALEGWPAVLGMWRVSRWAGSGDGSCATAGNGRQRQLLRIRRCRAVAPSCPSSSRWAPVRARRRDCRCSS